MRIYEIKVRLPIQPIAMSNLGNPEKMSKFASDSIEIRVHNITAMRVLVIDNHDSFVYNIVGLLRNIRRRPDFYDLEWEVMLNDVVGLSDVAAYDAVILSPGPGIPSEAGAMMEILDMYAGVKPFFGVCLGFQAIAERFGARLDCLPSPRHGHLSRLCRIDPNDPVVGSLAETGAGVGRYHSWVVDPQSLPSCLVATSYDEDGNLMSLRHGDYPVAGTQFHPESFMSDCGERILSSFLEKYVIARVP